MKKQNNSVSIMSVKSRISVTVLCALLSATEVNASNYSSTGLNTYSKEVKTEPKNENAMNRNSTWTIDNKEEAEEEQIIDTIARWIADSSYWSSEDSLLIDRKVSDNSQKVLKGDHSLSQKVTKGETFKFNAESYISESEF